jgi:hypothetical protein
MSSIPSVVALAPIVVVPGEKIYPAADVRGLMPNSNTGVELESVVSVVSIAVTPGTGLEVDTAEQASFDSSTISFWIDAAAATHGSSYTITITFKSRAAGGNPDGSDDRIRIAICPVLIRNQDMS